MTTRGQFINTVSRALGRATPLKKVPGLAWRHSVQKNVMKDWSRDELARAFVAYSKTIGAGVMETVRNELNASLRNAVDDCGPGPVILTDDPLLNGIRTAEAIGNDREVRVWNTEYSREENMHFAEKAVAGIAVAKLALAESATVLLFSHQGCGRSVTLLPESAIYVIPKSLIQPRLTQAMEFLRQCGEKLPSSVNFVSGPSATSDIELVRVVGVHGPLRVVHVVVNDM